METDALGFPSPGRGGDGSYGAHCGPVRQEWALSRSGAVAGGSRRDRSEVYVRSMRAREVDSTAMGVAVKKEEEQA